MQSDNDGESSIDEKNEDQEGVMLHQSVAGCSYRESSIDEKNEDQEGKRKCDQLKEELKAKEKKLEEKEEKLKSEKEELKSEKKELKEIEKKLESEKEELKEKEKKLESEKEELKEKEEELKEKEKKLEREIEELKQAGDNEHMQQIQLLQGRLTRLEDMQTQLQERHTQLQEEKTQLQKEQTFLQEQLTWIHKKQFEDNDDAPLAKRMKLDDAKCEWIEFLHLISSNVKDQNEWAWIPLTHHHNFNGISMLGKSRNELVKEIVTKITSLPQNATKDVNPYLAILAAPRQGKSLFLDSLCEHLRLNKVLAIGITYNSHSPFTDNEKTDIAPWLFARVIYAIVSAVTSLCIQWGEFQKYSFIQILTMQHVREVARTCKCTCTFNKIAVVVDEFTKCLEDTENEIVPKQLSKITSQIYSTGDVVVFSGFGLNDEKIVNTSSGRPVRSFFLLPVFSYDRHEYEPLLKNIKEYYTNQSFPHYLYECTKFSPGLLGLWLESLCTKNTVASIADLCPPIVQCTARKVEAEPSFFDCYWIHLFTNPRFPYKNKYLDKYERDDVIIRMDRESGFLNPFLLLHPKVFQYLTSNNNMCHLFECVQTAFTPLTWVPHTKGKALETLIVAALGLRQLYSGTVKFSFVLSTICGTEHYSNHYDSDDISVCFRKTFHHVDTFPCHWCYEEGSRSISNDIKQRRRKDGIQALKTNGVIIPLLKFNAGCDLVFVLDFHEGGMAVFFYEAKYYYTSELLDDDSASKKACIVLNELLDSSNPLGDCKVLAVSFIFCVTAETTIQYKLNFKGLNQKLSIQQCIDQLQQKGISVSLHILCLESEWVSILTPPLFHVLPDLAEHTKHSKLNCDV